VAQLKHLKTTVTNKNLNQETIKRRFNSCNAFYHSVQNPLCSRLYKSAKITSKIMKTNLAYSSVWVQNLVSDIKGGTHTEGVLEQGAEEITWTEVK
jgi:hypothetical protein